MIPGRLLLGNRVEGMVFPIGLAEVEESVPVAGGASGSVVEGHELVDLVTLAPRSGVLLLLQGQRMEFAAVAADILGNEFIHDEGSDRLLQLGAELLRVGLQEELLVGQDLVGFALARNLIKHIETTRHFGERAGNPFQVTFDITGNILPTRSGIHAGVTGIDLLEHVHCECLNLGTGLLDLLADSRQQTEGERRPLVVADQFPNRRQHLAVAA